MKTRKLLSRRLFGMITNYRHKLICAILFFLCIILSSCTNDSNTIISQELPEHKDTYFSGQLNPANQALSVEELAPIDDGISFRGEEYKLYCDSMRSTASVATFHWKIVLDYFSPVAETTDGHLICLPTEMEESDILIVSPSATPEYIACYVKAGSGRLSIDTYTLDDFTLSINGVEKPTNDPSFGKYWEMHTNINEKTSAHLDGNSRKNYQAVLVCNGCPWLSYELSWSVFGENDECVDIMNIYDVHSENSLHFHTLLET